MEPDLNALSVFALVAEERSFRAAADRLGVTRSAVSQTIRRLEGSLGIALVLRTTRSVSLTEAGERLHAEIAPAVAEMRAALEKTGVLQGGARGRLRLAVSSIAERFLSGPFLAGFAEANPEVALDITVTDEEFDIVAEGYDAGVRLGEQVAKDMIAVRIGPDFRMVVVGAPSYFAKRPLPKRPQDLTAHDCINIRLPTMGGLYAWEFEKRGRALKVRVDGQIVFNNMSLRHKAVLNGLGLAYLPEDRVRDHIASGRLVQVLDDWCQPFSGYHLYYPSRRQPTSAFAALVEALRYRG